METRGRVVNIARDIMSGKLNVTFQIDTEPIEELNEYARTPDVLDITAKKHRKRRSLDANAYAWVLMQKIAEKIHTDKWTVYLECLRRYSRSFSHVIVKPEAVEKMKELYRTSVDLGEVNVNGQTGHQLQVYFGSSSFDTKEMAVFIDGIVNECKELGIETIPPMELRRMLNLWQKSGEKQQ
jgi:hypothetical protein